MKKVMMLMAFLMATVISFAMDVHAENGVMAASKTYPSIQADNFSQENTTSCTVTQKGTLSLHFLQYEVTCSVTRENCKEAAAEALSCVREGIKRIWNNIQ
jgi:hypothetical protein